jgi:hypothetical protein
MAGWAEMEKEEKEDGGLAWEIKGKGNFPFIHLGI